VRTGELDRHISLCGICLIEVSGIVYIDTQHDLMPARQGNRFYDLPHFSIAYQCDPHTVDIVDGKVLNNPKPEIREN
jgi:hypothetical protein